MTEEGGSELRQRVKKGGIVRALANWKVAAPCLMSFIVEE